MSKNSLTHIVRSRPSWAISKPMTVCGNIAHNSDMTSPEMEQYIKNECRGSVNVAYGTCCVTCLQNQNNHFRHAGLSDEVSVLIDYLNRSGNRKHPDVKLQIDDEVQAVAELIAGHIDEFEAIVTRRQQVRDWTSKKPIST